MNLGSELSALFERDLDRLRSELDAIKDDEMLWIVAKDISNPPGNLILHICGNLKHYVGALLGGTGYVRERDLEFTGRATRVELVQNIDETKRIVTSFLADAPSTIWSQPCPQDPNGYEMSTAQLLIHLYGHLQYHLGQVNYHRRLL